MIDNGENGILSSYVGEACDQIHGNLLEWE